MAKPDLTPGGGATQQDASSKREYQAPIFGGLSDELVADILARGDDPDEMKRNFAKAIASGQVVTSSINIKGIKRTRTG